jgi:hypothetical protein
MEKGKGDREIRCGLGDRETGQVAKMEKVNRKYWEGPCIAGMHAY